MGFSFLLFLTCSPADIPLSQKLQEELQYEQEARTNEASPEFLGNFLEQGVWSVSQGAK